MTTTTFPHPEHHLPAPTLEQSQEQPTLVSFRDLVANPEELLQNGNIITDITGARDFDKLESIMAKRVNPGYYESPARDIVRKPLSQLLRPAKSTAEMRNGVAVVGYSSLTVATELWSRGKQAGARVCDVTYSPDNRTGREHITMRQANVLRHVTNLESTPDLLQTLHELNAQSAQQARELAANGLRHVILGGLPTLGKR